MANKVTVKRTFYFVTTAELDTIPRAAGNFIALSDADGMFYDVADPNGLIVRREVSGRIIFVESLPEVGDENNTYVLDTGTKLIGTDRPYYEVYCWENEAWQKIATNTNDVNVTAAVSNNTRYYLAGSASSTSNTGTLIKREDVFVETTGKLNVTGGYGGGPADSAINATNATNAVNATNATNDNLGNVISAYFKDVSSSGTAVTFTKGDGSTKSINTFSPPEVSTSAAGLVPQIPVDTSKNILTRTTNAAEWKPLDVSNLPAASAVNDGAGNQINSTYIKNLSFNDSNRKLTGIKGNDSTVEVVIPDTTYQAYAGPGTGAGLVPASTSGDAQRYFNVDGTFKNIPLFTGATSGANGTAGLVVAPQSSDLGKFLSADGTWDTVPYPPTFAGTDAGLVPQSDSDADKVLRGDGTWSAVPEYQGATALADGVAGLVNPATSADVDKFYKADGTWVDLPTMQGTTTVQDGSSGMVPTPTTSDYGKFLGADGNWGMPSIPIFSVGVDGAVPGPASSSADNFLNSTGNWSTPIRNTTGANNVGTTTQTYTNQFYGDGSTVSFTLTYVPNAGSLTATLEGTALVEDTDYTLVGNIITMTNAPTVGNVTDNFTVDADSNRYILSGYANSIVSVTVDGTALTPTTDYALSDNNVLVLLNQASYTVGDAIVVVFVHPQVLNASYQVSLSNAKMFIISAPTQYDYVQTYTENNAYVIGGKLYSDAKEVLTIDNIISDTSFSVNAGLDIDVNKVGNSYYITLDGVATGSINAGSAIASSTKTFTKTYSMGIVGTSPALFTLNGNTITCDTNISSNDSVAVSFNALA